MLKILKNAGVLIVTGAMAVMGLIIGTVTFKPESVSFNDKDTDDKNEKGAK